MHEGTTNSLPNLLRGNTDSLLLFLVDQLGASYGYRLIKEIERRSAGYLRFKEGTVYPALRKLENDGLLEASWAQASAGQERRYYRITDKGRATLRRKLATWEDFTAAMNLVLRSAGG